MFKLRCKVDGAEKEIDIQTLLWLDGHAFGRNLDQIYDIAVKDVYALERAYAFLHQLLSHIYSEEELEEIRERLDIPMPRIKFPKITIG